MKLITLNHWTELKEKNIINKICTIKAISTEDWEMDLVGRMLLYQNCVCKDTPYYSGSFYPLNHFLRGKILKENRRLNGLDEDFVVFLYPLKIEVYEHS